jgi:23S rRNA (cytidine1920-2'-O)/16S rRNA (cytidine1409-2'-O)-methyltransferase
VVRKGQRPLIKALVAAFPSLEDPATSITTGHVTVDGQPNRNPNSIVGPGATVSLTSPAVLRGEAKLRAALTTFDIPVDGIVALDVGAAAGGFTRVLLERGAKRVYAVDAGHGQLLGSLRQHERVVNLEATNLGELNRLLVPDAIALFTLDLSYLSLCNALPQLDLVAQIPVAHVVALVKPMFELHLPEPPSDRPRLEHALSLAVDGFVGAGWTVVSTMDSPVTGARGAVEFLIHARRQGPG